MESYSSQLFIIIIASHMWYFGVPLEFLKSFVVMLRSYNSRVWRLRLLVFSFVDYRIAPWTPFTKLGLTYRKTSNIRRPFVGNKIVDHSDVVGASPVGAAPTKSSFST